jgi:putative hydrolases of HD superfamily
MRPNRMAESNQPNAHIASNELSAIMKFMRLSERLKTELRHSWLSSGRRESVAEHTWNMGLLAMLSAPHLEHKVDVFKAIKMTLIHDLVEIIVGDIPFTEVSDRKLRKQVMEQEAMVKIRAMLPEPAASEIFDLWHEFEECKSVEAKFVKALDNLEVQIQHNLADLATWEEIEFDLVYTKMGKHTSHDAFLSAMCDAVISDAEDEMRSFGANPEEIKARVT